MPPPKDPDESETIAMALVEDVLRSWPLADIEQLVEEIEMMMQKRPSRAPQLCVTFLEGRYEGGWAASANPPDQNGSQRSSEDYRPLRRFGMSANLAVHR